MEDPPAPRRRDGRRDGRHGDRARVHPAHGTCGGKSGRAHRLNRPTGIRNYDGTRRTRKIAGNRNTGRNRTARSRHSSSLPGEAGREQPPRPIDPPPHNGRQPPSPTTEIVDLHCRTSSSYRSITAGERLAPSGFRSDDGVTGDR